MKLAPDRPPKLDGYNTALVQSDAGVMISKDGCGRCMDNIFIERLWRSLKYEAVYLHELPGGRTPAEAHGADRTVDTMDKARALPASPQAHQQKGNLLNRILAA